MPTADITVKKDGSVLRGADAIGRVEKVDPTDSLHLRGEGQSVHISFSRKPVWHAYAADGTQLTEFGADTRKSAVRTVELHARPLEVSDVKIEHNYTGDPYVSAWVTWQGNSAGVSRYPHERGWIMDSLFEGSGFPIFSNGSGTRFTKPRFLQEDRHDAANAAAIAAGLLTADDATSWADLMGEVERIKASQV